MNLSERFHAAFRSAGTKASGAEMTAVHLSMACASVLPVAGAGISVFSSNDFRAPIGASHDEASAAERLQFTTGQGPCLAAHSAGRTVLATENEMAARWPEFHRQLTAGTPYTAIAAIPLAAGLGGIGALDLYFCRPDDLTALVLADALTVADLIAAVLARQEWRLNAEGTAEPPWLNTSVTRGRAVVSVAMGMVAVTAGVNFSDALALLRAQAHSTGRTLDDLSSALVSGRTSTEVFELDGNG